MTVVPRPGTVLLAAALALLPVGPPPLQAAEAAGQTDPAYGLSLPAGPLADSLSRLSAATGIQIIGDAAVLRGRMAPALSGRFTVGAALGRLLAGQPVQVTRRGQALLIGPAVPVPVRSPPAGADPLDMEEVVVIGRVGVSTRHKMDSSYAVTTLDETVLLRQPAPGLAPLLARVPGLWVDQSAGLAANTVRVRGMPWDGYSALAIHEDGLPIQHEVGLAWTDVDQFFRLDTMVTGMEHVRGGPAAIFASNAPGGMLNLTTRTGGPRPEALARLTTSDYGLLRLDAHVAGPLAPDWRAALGGFYSRDPNVRRIKGHHDGGQIRLNLTRDLRDGTLDLGLRHLDDQSFNTSSYPLQRIGGRIRGIPGFDPLYDSWFGPDLGAIRFRDGDGSRTRSLLANNENRLTAGTLRWHQDLAEDTRLSLGLRLRSSATRRSSVISSGAPEPGAELLRAYLPAARAAFPATQRLVLRYARDPGRIVDPADGNGLVVRTTPTYADVDLDERLGSAVLSHRLELAGQLHDLSIGVYGARYDWDYARDGARALMEVRGQGRLLDLVALDAAGHLAGRVSDDGILNDGTIHERLTSRNRLTALYVSDEWQVTPALRLDGGVRREWLSLMGAAVPTAPRNLGDPATLADDAVRSDAGPWRPFDLTRSATAVSLGADWRLGPDLGLFGRLSRGFRMPDPGAFRSGEAVPAPQPDRVRQAELGVKWSTDALGLFLTAFLNRFTDPDFGDTVQDPGSGLLVQRRVQADVRTPGLEAELEWQPRRPLALGALGPGRFELGLTLTWQDPAFRRYDAGPLALAPDHRFIGNMPRRLPRTMVSARPALLLLDGRLRLDGEWQYMSRRYADDANTLPLPAFSLFSAGAEARLSPGLTLAVRGSNLTNRLAVMQGDYWTGEIVSAQAGRPWFIGRTLPGRAVTLSLTWAMTGD